MNHLKYQNVYKLIKLFKNIDLFKIIVIKKFMFFTQSEKRKKRHINLIFALKKGF